MTTGYSKNTPGSQATSTTWARACAAGDTIILAVQHQSTGNTAVASVTDNSGGTNAWTKVGSSLDASTPGTAGRVVDLWKCTPTAAITSITLTASAATYWVLQAVDYAGARTVRNSAVWFGTAGPQAGVSAVSGDQLLTFVGYAATTGGTDMVTVSGWTELGFNNISTTQSDLFALTAGSTGTTTPSFTVSATIGVVTLALAPAATSAVPPTVTGPGSINTTASTASLTFQGSDSDGTISSFACVNQSNTANTTVTPTIGTPTVTGAGTANASATFPVSGMTANAKYFFGGTAADNNGNVSATSVATVNVTKDIPDIRSVVTTGFTVVGGGTALDAIVAGNAQAAAGQTVTRYLESASPPGGATCTVTFQPITPSTVARAFAFPVRAKDTTTTETATVTLKMNDNTTIATRGPITLTTTAAGCGGTTTLGTGSETAAITDYSKLSVTVVTN